MQAPELGVEETMRNYALEKTRGGLWTISGHGIGDVGGKLDSCTVTPGKLQEPLRGLLLPRLPPPTANSLPAASVSFHNAEVLTWKAIEPPSPDHVTSPMASHCI